MAKHGKKFQALAKLVDEEKLYTVEEAIALVKETAKAKFDESVEVAFKLGVDPRHADQQIRNALVLPNGTGKTQRVLVFCKGENVKIAEEAGADYVGNDEFITKIQGGWLDFDVAVATPDMMASVGRLGRILGTRGLMPNPKTGTVTPDVKKAIEEIKAGKIEYRVEKAGIIHAIIGKASFSNEALIENFHALAQALIKAKPAAQKGVYMKSIAVSATMGPGIKINPTQVV